MYAEYLEKKLAWTTFLRNFHIPLVQHICGAIMNSCLIESVTVFLKISFDQLF